MSVITIANPNQTLAKFRDRRNISGFPVVISVQRDEYLPDLPIQMRGIFALDSDKSWNRMNAIDRQDDKIVLFERAGDCISQSAIAYSRNPIPRKFVPSLAEVIYATA